MAPANTSLKFRTLETRKPVGDCPGGVIRGKLPSDMEGYRIELHNADGKQVSAVAGMAKANGTAGFHFNVPTNWLGTECKLVVPAPQYMGIVKPGSDHETWVELEYVDARTPDQVRLAELDTLYQDLAVQVNLMRSFMNGVVSTLSQRITNIEATLMLGETTKIHVQVCPMCRADMAWLGEEALAQYEPKTGRCKECNALVTASFEEFTWTFEVQEEQEDGVEPE